MYLIFKKLTECFIPNELILYDHQQTETTYFVYNMRGQRWHLSHGTHIIIYNLSRSLAQIYKNNIIHVRVDSISQLGRRRLLIQVILYTVDSCKLWKCRVFVECGERECCENCFSSLHIYELPNREGHLKQDGGCGTGTVCAVGRISFVGFPNK